MPGTEIKAAVAALLNASFVAPAGDGSLKQVLTQYPRVGELENYPRVVLWATRHAAQEMVAGGRTAVSHSGPSGPLGLRKTAWELSLHVKTLLDDPLDGSGAAFDQLIDNIETMLTQYPDLKGALGTTPSGTGFNGIQWRVTKTWGMRRENIPPLPVNELQVAMNCFIYTQIEEYWNA